MPFTDFLILALALLGYFLPALVAFMRGHHNAGAIFVLNTVLGWTFVFWALALVWASTAVRRERLP